MTIVWWEEKMWEINQWLLKAEEENEEMKKKAEENDHNDTLKSMKAWLFGVKVTDHSVTHDSISVKFLFIGKQW